MTQTRLKENKEVKYSFGPYDKSDEKEQWIRITEGCPNDCPYCYEPTELKVFGIPEIIRNEVKIMDMNLLCKPEAMSIISQLAQKRVAGKPVKYELICGIDYRYLNDEFAEALHKARFRKIRLAWDWQFKAQIKIANAVKMLKRAGYSGRNIMIFMICNWKIPYEENLKKLDLCKVWNVQVADCWFDNQTSPNIIPIHWTEHQIKDFRARCRKHNQMISYGIDPEVFE